MLLEHENLFLKVLPISLPRIMTSKDSCIKIPIIPYGLRQEETIVHIAAAMENINATVTDVFQQIECNINRHKQYLISLQERSVIIASKVDKLAGRNVTTTVYSHYKFPYEVHKVDTLFKIKLKPPNKKIDVPIKSKFQPAKYNKIPNKLQFFHVKSKVDSRNDLAANVTYGLGGLPPKLNYVDSLFLFNSTQNVYDKYILLDPLSITVSGPVTEETEKTDIAAAPNSIIKSEIFRNEDYFTGFYTPTFEEVQRIDVPVDLPDLPGIAGDHDLDSVPEKLIAPSKQVQEVKSKSIDEISITDLPIKPTVSSQEISTSHAGQNNDIYIDSMLPVSSPPPPPPMPLYNQCTEKMSTSNVERDPVAPKITAPGENIHAALMEAIRKAGGKEKAPLRQVSLTDNQQESKDGNGNIFMTDLYAALARRRKGISGPNKDDRNVSMMDRVSAMIPPTSDESSNNSAEDEGNDWED